jgi:hypothetical protein
MICNESDLFEGRKYCEAGWNREVWDESSWSSSTILGNVHTPFIVSIHLLNTANTMALGSDSNSIGPTQSLAQHTMIWNPSCFKPSPCPAPSPMVKAESIHLQTTTRGPNKVRISPCTSRWSTNHKHRHSSKLSPNTSRFSNCNSQLKSITRTRVQPPKYCSSHLHRQYN